MAGCAPSGLDTPSSDEEIEIGGGAICTVIVGTLSSEAGAPDACAVVWASANVAVGRQSDNPKEAALKKRRLISVKLPSPAPARIAFSASLARSSAQSQPVPATTFALRPSQTVIHALIRHPDGAGNAVGSYHYFSVYKRIPHRLAKVRLNLPHRNFNVNNLHGAGAHNGIAVHQIRVSGPR